MAAAQRWQGWAGFALGLWLAVSPWVMGYSAHDAPTANAAFLGLILALASHFEASSDETAVHWLILATGAWLVAAPFVFGFAGAAAAAGNSIVVGIAAAGLAASALGLGKELDKWRHRSVAGH